MNPAHSTATVLIQSSEEQRRRAYHLGNQLWLMQASNMDPVFFIFNRGCFWANAKTEGNYLRTLPDLA